MSIDMQHQGSRDIVSRVKAILMTPKTEWPIIAAETTTVADLYKNYVIILAAIPAVAGFIKMSIIGTTIPFAGTFRVGMMSGLTTAILTYVLSLVAIYIVALIIDALAPTFGAVKDQMQALKTAAYAYTAYWVASVAQIVPVLGMLIVLAGAVYSLYLLYLGLPFTMKAPADKALPYTAVVVVCTFVIMLLLGVVVTTVAGVGQFGAGGFGAPRLGPAAAPM